MSAFDGLRFVSDADPDLVRTRAAAREGQLDPALAAIEAESGDARSFVVQVLTRLGRGQLPPREALVAAAEAEPARAAVALLHAAWLIEYGWSIRGGGVASGVSATEFASFHASLEAAKQHLSRAIELDPGDPAPWVYLIEIARCESDGREAQRCFDEAVARDPDCYGAHRQLLSTKTPKWGGSEEALLAFVDEIRSTRPPGTLVHLIEVDAQIERWLWRFGFKDDKDAAIALAYDEDVRARVDAAVAAARSAPNYRDNRLSLIIRNGLSFWYYMSGRLDDLREELEGLDGVFTEGYWGYINAPPMVYARARFRAGLGPDPMAEDEGEEGTEVSPEPAPASTPYAPQPSLEGDAEVELPAGPGMLAYGAGLTVAAGLLAYFAVTKAWGFPAWLGVFILGVSGISVIVGVARQGT